MKRRIRWMEIEIPVEYDPDAEMQGWAVTNWDFEKGTFSLRFKKAYVSVIAHECWHLFMRIMQWMDKFNAYSFEELSTEIYAWNFGILVGKVTDALQKMQRERLDEEAEEDEEDNE